MAGSVIQQLRTLSRALSSVSKLRPFVREDLQYGLGAQRLCANSV